MSSRFDPIEARTASDDQDGGARASSEYVASARDRHILSPDRRASGNGHLVSPEGPFFGTRDQW
jgi:hypothetical protein